MAEDKKLQTDLRTMLQLVSSIRKRKQTVQEQLRDGILSGIWMCCIADYSHYSRPKGMSSYAEGAVWCRWDGCRIEGRRAHPRIWSVPGQTVQSGQ